MLYILPRSTFHHTVLSGKLGPTSIAVVCMHVAVFPSIALLASKLLLVYDWVAILLWDISSVNKKIKKTISMKYVKISFNKEFDKTVMFIDFYFKNIQSNVIFQMSFALNRNYFL